MLNYITQVIIPCVIVVTIVAIAVSVIKLSLAQSFDRCVLSITTTILTLVASVYSVGLTKIERQFINNKIKTTTK